MTSLIFSLNMLQKKSCFKKISVRNLLEKHDFHIHISFEKNTLAKLVLGANLKAYIFIGKLTQKKNKNLPAFQELLNNIHISESLKKFY